MPKYSVFYTKKGTGVIKKTVTASSAIAAKKKIARQVAGITSISARKIG